MTTTTHTRIEDTNSLTSAITVVVRPPPPLPPQLPPRGSVKVLRITRTEAQTDASQAPFALVTDRSRAGRPLLPVRRQHCREKNINFTRFSRPRLTQRSPPTCSALAPRVAPYFGPTQRLSHTDFIVEPPGIFPGIGSPRLKRRPPHPGQESRRIKRGSPEPRTAQHHTCRAVASFVSARVPPSFTSRPCGGGRFEVREGQHRNPEISV